MPIRSTTSRKALLSSRFCCPVSAPTTIQAIAPTEKTAKPQPVTRAPRLAAVMMAAIIVAAGAIQPASANIALTPRSVRPRTRAGRSRSVTPRAAQGSRRVDVEQIGGRAAHPGDAELAGEAGIAMAETRLGGAGAHQHGVAGLPLMERPNRIDAGAKAHARRTG